MNEIITIFTRVWTDITSGAHMPLSFRLTIQPLDWVYPFKAMMVAVILAVLPYLVMRGLVNRILRHRHGGNEAI